MGRTAAGVRGMSLRADDRVVGMEILSPGAPILPVPEKGYGKRTPLVDYRLQPILTASNALLGQLEDDLSDLRRRLRGGDVDALAISTAIRITCS